MNSIIFYVLMAAFLIGAAFSFSGAGQQEGGSGIKIVLNLLGLFFFSLLIFFIYVDVQFYNNQPKIKTSHTLTQSNYHTVTSILYINQEEFARQDNGNILVDSIESTKNLQIRKLEIVRDKYLKSNKDIVKRVFFSTPQNASISELKSFNEDFHNSLKSDSFLIMQMNQPSQFEYSTDGKTWKVLDTIKYKFIRKKEGIDPGTINNN